MCLLGMINCKGLVFGWLCWIVVCDLYLLLVDFDDLFGDLCLVVFKFIFKPVVFGWPVG